jgi:hypothetical protein
VRKSEQKGIKDKYRGRFIATKDFNSTKVITYGKDAGAVHSRAIKRGCKSPVVSYVPKENMYHIF